MMAGGAQYGTPIGNLLEYVCGQLEQHNIAYMLSGSVAMSTYTIPRFTRDIDLVIDLQLEDADTLEAIFAGNYYFHRPSVDEEIKRRGMFNVIDGTSGLKVDFMVKKQTPYRQTEFSRRRQDVAYGATVWIVSVDDLILSKLIWIQDYESGQQKTDIQSLLTDNEIDLGYVRYWIDQLNLKTYGLL